MNRIKDYWPALADDVVTAEQQEAMRLVNYWRTLAKMWQADAFFWHGMARWSLVANVALAFAVALLLWKNAK